MPVTARNGGKRKSRNSMEKNRDGYYLMNIHKWQEEPGEEV